MLFGIGGENGGGGLKWSHSTFIYQNFILLNLIVNQRDMTPQNNNNCESFYQCLEDVDYFPESIILGKDIDGIQKLLLPGQRFIGEDKFVLIDPISKQYQMLYLTNYRVVIDRVPAISIPYGYIQQLKPLQKFIRVILKTGLHFDFYLDANQPLFEQTLGKMLNCRPFCLNFVGQKQYPNIYDSYAEIQRMRVDSRFYSVFKNAGAKFCATYPLYFLVPKGIEVSNLNQIKKCRFYSRIPVMSYYNERTSVGIWRAAKRKSQISQQILKYDISYIRSIPGNSIILQLQQTPQVRSNLNFQSLQNLKQTFFQLTKHYSNSLQNPLTSKADMYKALNKWYDQIDRLLSLAYSAVDLINQGHHVLLEERYGYDRVTQVLVLAEIVMDPFFRTFDGLSILLEKEFVSYGHPFQDRCGFSRNKENQISPIFIQVLQCINQLINSHPSCFEYSSSYLARIAYEVYTTKYKNFIFTQGDPQKQKSYNRCSMNIWQSLSNKKFRSPQYDKQTKRELWEVRKKPSIKQYTIWVEYFDKICLMLLDNN